MRFGTGDYTIETFFYAYGIVSDGYGSTIFSKGYLRSGFYLGDFFASVAYPAGASWSANTWYHYVQVRSSGFETNYRNAISLGSIASPDNQSNIGTPFAIAKFSPDNAGYFGGIIPIVRMYNRALSATEILQNYNALKGRYGL